MAKFVDFVVWLETGAQGGNIGVNPEDVNQLCDYGDHVGIVKLDGHDVNVVGTLAEVEAKLA